MDAGRLQFVIQQAFGHRVREADLKMAKQLNTKIRKIAWIELQVLKEQEEEVEPQLYNRQLPLTY